MAEQKWLLDGPKVIDLGPIQKLKVALVRGQVDIVGHDEPTTRVEVHSVSGKELRVAIDGDSLEIDHPQLRWDNFIDVFRSFRGNASADVSVLVPRDVALKFGVVSSTRPDQRTRLGCDHQHGQRRPRHRQARRATSRSTRSAANSRSRITPAGSPLAR